jgi:transposase
MSNTIYPDYNQQFLLPQSLEDWIPLDHPARFIREFVESINFAELGFKERESEVGRGDYSNDLLLKVWLYGYFEKIYSNRGLERACYKHMALVWLTGINYPDHNTIWRFFRRNRASIKKVFKQTVQIAIKNDLVGFAVQAIDGTKIYADASKRRSLHKDDLKKLLSGLDESVDEIISEIEETHKRELSQPEYKLPERFHNKENLKRLINEGLEELSIEEKRTLKKAVEASIEELDKEKTNHLSLSDKQSRLMKTKGGNDFCYNAQGAVDEKEHIIVAASVTNEESDRHQMTKMVEECKENTGKAAEETLMDGGYFSGEELAKAEEENYSVLVNVPSSVDKDCSEEGAEFNKSKFTYESETDTYVCPEGNKLVFKRTVKRKNQSYEVRVYQCTNYRECPSRWKCSKAKLGRTVERTPYEEVIYRQVRKQKQKEKKYLLSKRKQIVEPVFGWIKHNNGFNRWLYRGLENVEAQWNLICTSVNLKKLYTHWMLKRLAFD